MLFNNDYKKIDPNLFKSYLRLLTKRSHDFAEYELKFLLANPKIIFDKKYKNLDADVGDIFKIERKLHQLLITKPQGKDEISDKDIRAMAKTHEFLLKSGQPWKHLIWTNDIDSVKKLKTKISGIEIRDLSEIRKSFKADSKIDDLIAQVARHRISSLADYLKYEIIRIEGGVFLDLDSVLKKDLEDDMHKFDFIGSTDHMMGDSGYHIAPLVFEWEKNLPPVQLYDTVNLLAHAYYKNANNNTTDVVYPLDPNLTKGTVFNNDELFQKSRHILIKYLNGSQELDFIDMFFNFNDYLHAYEICGTNDHFVGTFGEKEL